MLTFGSLFAGIGGFDLGFERAGMRGVWQVEIDPFCQRVLRKNFPHAAQHGDITTLTENELESVDLICGGFPCQDVSLAGQRKGLEGERSTLWTEFARIVRTLKPRWIVVENVVGLLSSDDGRFFGNILRDLDAVGYDAEWCVIPASFVGAFHRRERIWIVAHPQSIGLQTPFFQRSDVAESRIQKPKQWQQFFSIPTGAYQIDERWKIYQDSVCGNDDGLSGQLDRFKQLGNAVVPQIAEWIGRRIVELDD